MAWWELENEPEPALAQEVEDAYRRFWDVRAQAFLNLDTSRLNEVETGPALERDEAAIRDFNTQGRTQKLDVEHASRVVFASGEEAVVYDEFTSSSVFVDTATKQEIPTDKPPLKEAISTLLRYSDGQWRVFDAVRRN